MASMNTDWCRGPGNGIGSQTSRLFLDSAAEREDKSRQVNPHSEIAGRITKKQWQAASKIAK